MPRPSLLPFAGLVLIATPFAQDNRKLSLPLLRVPTGRVESYRVSRDGQRLTYVADPGSSGEHQLHRAAVRGGEPVVELGSALPGPRDHDLDRRGERVFFRALEGSQIQLKTRRGDAGDAARTLNGPLAAGGNVLDFLLAPDDARVLYRADQELDQRLELYVAATVGGLRAKVSGTLPAGASVEGGYAFLPNGNGAVFLLQLGSNTSELFRGSLNGGPSTRLSSVHSANRVVLDFALTADGQRVVYLADSRANDLFELFVVPSDGSSAPVRIGPDLVSGGDVKDFVLTPDGRFAVLAADAELRNRVQLYSVELSSGAWTALTPGLPDGADVLLDFVASEDGSRVLYRANPDARTNTELFVVPVDGSAPARRLGPDLDSGQQVLGEFQLRGERVVYLLEDAGALGRWITSVELAPNALPRTLSPGFSLSLLPRFEVGPTRVVFQSEAGGYASAPIDGSAASVPLELPRDSADSFNLVNAGEVVLATVSSIALTELASQPADASAPVRTLNAEFPRTRVVEFVHASRPSPRGEHALYRTSGARSRLVLVDTSGREEPILLDDPAPGTAQPDPFRADFTHDGTRVVYVQDDVLKVRAVTPGGTPRALSGPVADFQLARAGEVALASTYDVAQGRLVAVPLDGSTPVDLTSASGLLVTPTFGLRPDGAQAYFLALDGLGVLGLYRVPTDGSGSPERLGAGETAEFVESPDGSLLAFVDRTDRERLQVTRFEPGAPVHFVHEFQGSSIDRKFLFDASGRRLAVLDAFDLYLYGDDGSVRQVSRGRSIQSLLLEPSGRSLLYLVGVEGSLGGFTFDLWTEPLDGSAAPRRLNLDPAGPAQATLGRITHVPVSFSPDGRRVAFPEPDKLVVATLDGSPTHVVVAEDPTRFDFVELAFAPDSATLLFSSDGLFQVPANGAREPRRIDTPGAFGGLRTPGDFQLLSTGRGVLFLGDLASEFATELFLGRLGHAVRGASR